MIIEFTGVSASGKTTIAKLLVKELNRKGYVAELQFPEDNTTSDRTLRLGKKAWMCASIFLTKPGYTLNLFSLVYSNTDLNFIQKINLISNGMYIKKILERASISKSITVLHQGYFQFIHSVGRQSDESVFHQIIETMIPWSTLPDFVIHVSADSQLIESRLSQRNMREKNRNGHVGSLPQIALSERLMIILSQHIELLQINRLHFTTNNQSKEQLDIEELVKTVTNCE